MFFRPPFGALRPGVRNAIAHICGKRPAPCLTTPAPACIIEVSHALICERRRRNGNHFRCGQAGGGLPLHRLPHLKVRRAMVQLGYEPNFQATSLATQNSRTFGILLPPLEYEAYQKNFYLEAIRGIGLFCNQKQYTNTILTGQSDEELLQSVQSMVKSGRVEGFILLYAREDDPILAYLQAEGVLYVLIGQSKKDLEDTIYVNNDNIQACRELTSMLIEMGHRRIAYISDEWQHNYAQDRKSGYLLAMTEHQLPIRPEYILESSGLPEENDGKLTALFSLPQRPTAIVASDDVLAMALERVVLSLGLRIPQDLSIAAFNDSLFSRLACPQLTSVNINAQQLGIEAASQIINHIENPDLLAAKIIVPHRIIRRASCCPPPPEEA